jgi:hypothetical protein
MHILKRAGAYGVGALSVAALMHVGHTTHAQDITHACQPARVIPLTAPEPAAKLVIDRPLAEPLATRGVVVIPYCAEHLRFAPMFGTGALTISPRVGHIHVTVDAAPWHWADASGNPIILQALPPGAHSVRIDLVNANHQVIDTGTITFTVPQLTRQ